MSDRHAQQAHAAAMQHAVGQRAPDAATIESGPALVLLHRRVIGLRERLDDAVMRVARSLDRADGGELLDPIGDPNALTDGVLHTINAELDAIDGLLQRLAAQADRLESIA